MSNTPNDQNNLSPEQYAQQNPVGTDGGTTGTGLPAGYVGPATYRQAPDLSPTILAGKAPKSSMVSVPGVVSARNVVQPYYVPAREAKTILAGLDDVTRLRLQQQMYAAGWYGSRTPQFVTAAKKGTGYIGLSGPDYGAFSELLFTANTQGVTWDVLLNSVSKAPKSVSGIGSGRATPSSADLEEILQRTSLETIGRKLDDKAVKSLVAGYQSSYRSATSEQPAQADVYFKNSIESKYGAETEATKYLTAISTVAKMLGG